MNASAEKQRKEEPAPPRASFSECLKTTLPNYGRSSTSFAASSIDARLALVNPRGIYPMLKKTALAGALITPEPPAIPSLPTARPFKFVSVSHHARGHPHNQPAGLIVPRSWKNHFRRYRTVALPTNRNARRNEGVSWLRWFSCQQSPAIDCSNIERERPSWRRRFRRIQPLQPLPANRSRSPRYPHPRP
jgi:hypothetical protein